MAVELQEIGLVERVIVNPLKYRALPVREAASILLQRMHENNIESQKKAMKLIEHINGHKTAKTLEVEPQLVMIPERGALLLRLSRSIEASQIGIDTVCSWETCVRALSDLSALYRRALDRGVKIRYVTSKPPNKETITEIMEELVENSLFELMFADCKLMERLGIYDNKEVYIALRPESKYIGSPALWSNSAPLVELAQNYFNTLWKKAVKA